MWRAKGSAIKNWEKAGHLYSVRFVGKKERKSESLSDDGASAAFVKKIRRLFWRSRIKKYYKQQKKKGGKVIRETRLINITVCIHPILILCVER